METVKTIDAFALRYKEPHYRGLERWVTLVRLETTGGAVGWGEALTRYRGAALATRVLALEAFAPIVQGQSPIDVEVLWRKMCASANWFGTEGLAALAISAFDMALWDLKGKLLGQPVSKLLGGQVHSEIPAMASIIFDMDDLDWTLNEFRGFREAGYRIVKAGWGMRVEAMFGQDRQRDLHYLREIRKVIGTDISLVVDIPGPFGVWDSATAIRRIREWEEFDLRWVEQPLKSADLDGYARLRAAVTTPIGTGEDEWGLESYTHLIRSQGADILQLDPAWALGLTGCRQVVMAVEAAGLKYNAHTWSSAVNTAASLHMVALSPAGDTLDFKPHDSPMQHDLVEDPWVPVNGMLALRDIPGLGITVREDAMKKYAVT
ncbi:MAG: mandelate racemase/muconate lactonizing enzyme family protein [Parvibaculaceae bacterium]